MREVAREGGRKGWHSLYDGNYGFGHGVGE